jgi:glycosyltransferase involved in cell wall biosynthesis
MKHALVLISDGPFGGAQKRFLTLFFYINRNLKGKLIFLVSYSLFEQIKIVFPEEQLDSIIAVGPRQTQILNNNNNKVSSDSFRYLRILQIIKKTLIYRFYYFFKSWHYQKKIYNEIEHYRKKYQIGVFLGIYSGILPLYFYFSETKRPAIIFTNMDSWFSNILLIPQKEWYRKYVSFNYAHEKSDLIDFLSPFIYEGIQKLGVKVDPGKVNITACSFTDYSKCKIGVKNKFRIAFSGRLEKDKNPEMFLQAAILLAEEFQDVEFHIMGEGRLSEKISERVLTSGLSNIIFHGFHPNPPEILSETSIFVSIQTTNNYPSQSVLEAMACGNTIIASDVGDTRKFINDLNGTLIPLDLLALRDAIHMYIENPEAAKEKGLYASEYVRGKFSIKKAAEYYMDLLTTAQRKLN